MDLTVQDGVARAAFSNAPIATTNQRGIYISVDEDQEGNLVAVSFSNKNVATLVVNLLSKMYGLTPTDEEKASLLSAL